MRPKWVPVLILLLGSVSCSDAAEDIPDSGAEACTPQCEDRECGHDGCGGSCGECYNQCTLDPMTGCSFDSEPDPSLCGPDGWCEHFCCPSCCGKECGPDGCGGTCGLCDDGLECDLVGQCHGPCVPNCEGKVCGVDGCGGTCGECNGCSPADTGGPYECQDGECPYCCPNCAYPIGSSEQCTECGAPVRVA